MHDVFVLGAGFSHAVSDAMPLTRDLTQLTAIAQIVEGADSQPERIFREKWYGLVGDDFELLLTYLSSDAPWLSEAAVAGVIRAVERDKPKVDVAPFVVRAGGVLAYLAPETFSRLARRSGSRRTDRRARSGPPPQGMTRRPDTVVVSAAAVVTPMQQRRCGTTRTRHRWGIST